MMSLLKRFEEAAPDEHLDENSDSEGDEHGLTERLASLDLGLFHISVYVIAGLTAAIQNLHLMTKYGPG